MAASVARGPSSSCDCMPSSCRWRRSSRRSISPGRFPRRPAGRRSDRVEHLNQAATARQRHCVVGQGAQGSAPGRRRRREVKAA
jgi:hypothetical protein